MISVYEYGGKERVSIYAGGNDDSAEKHGDFLWQFSLNGTGPAQKECPECNGQVCPKRILGRRQARRSPMGRSYSGSEVEE